MNAYGLPLLALLLAALPVRASGSGRPEDVVRAMFDAFNRHDATALAALYAPDALLTSPDFCAPRRGSEGARRTYQALFEAMPDIRDTVDEMVVQGDRVAVRFRARAIVQGQPVELPIAAFMQVSEGRIVRDQSFFDPPSPACSP
jgi:ketosteroid isomerase-like protein